MKSAPARGVSLPILVIAAGAVVLSLIPWWNSEIPLSLTRPTLNIWQLLALGFSIEAIGGASGFSWLGNALFGLPTSLTVIPFIIAFILGGVSGRLVPTRVLRNLAVAAMLGTIWLIVFSWLRQDASNGHVLIGLGALIFLPLSIAGIVVAQRALAAERRRAERARSRNRSAEHTDEGLREIMVLEEDASSPRRAARGTAMPRMTLQELRELDADVDEEELTDTGLIRLETLREEMEQARRRERR